MQLYDFFFKFKLDLLNIVVNIQVWKLEIYENSNQNSEYDFA